eukprot:Seg381.29 transcript_id=Seg381.29/GoldUCD/mRNA.D3Y31 product="Ankyrin repeat domain-containing protein 63" protein_id=Seg381.29/GoldUCD/D3Y31
MSSLHTAIINARLCQIRTLLTVGMKVDKKDAQGRTPLMVACFMTNEKRRQIVCDLLLAHGANVDLMDKFKRTMLMYACATRNKFLLHKLIECIDTDLNKMDKDGNTCLMYAAIEGNAGVMKLMLQPFEMYGISLDVRNKRGFTAYLLALKNGNVECAQILQNKGASTNIFDSENYWGGKEWLSSHNNNRINRERLQSAHIGRSKTENMRRREDNHYHGILQRPRSMPPLLDYSDYQETSNSQAFYQNKQGVRKRKPNSVATSLGTNLLHDRSLESKSKMAAKGLKLSRPLKGSSSSKTVPGAKETWDDENENDITFAYQAKEIRDYGINAQPLPASSFRSEAMKMEGTTDFGDSISISTRSKHHKKQQQQQLIKIFEEYSINQVPIPLAIPKQYKKENDTQQRPLKATEMQKREQTYFSTFNIPQRKRRLSTVRAKINDMKAEMRALNALNSGKFANS